MKTVVFDFDGVIHSYSSGWQGEDVVADPPVRGIKEALHDISDAGYEIVIVSSRSNSEKGRSAIRRWLIKYDLFQYIDHICAEKPPAVVYIDDRAIQFDGRPELLLNKINTFVPWTQL